MEKRDKKRLMKRGVNKKISHFGSKIVNKSLFRQNTRAQLTIFIIIALVLIAVLLILFYPKIKVLVAGPAPTSYIEKCTEEAAEEALEKIRFQGGSLEPENYILYEDNKVEYVCYTNEYYKKCVMQKPFLKQDIEKELISYVEPRVKQCFESYKEQLEKSGSSVRIQDIEIEVSIVPNSIVVTINAPTTITKEGAISFGKFKTNVNSQLYDLIMLSSSIANYEARYGDSDTLTYMLYYPDIKVEKKSRDEGRVYILTHKPSGEKFMFASRSIAWPAGYVGS